MGSYGHFCVGGYPLFATKSYVDPTAMTVFRETDRLTFTRKLAERNPTIWGVPDEEYVDEDEIAYLYSCTVSVAIERLNVLGFTLSRVRSRFEELRKCEIATLSDRSDEDARSNALWESRISLLRGLTFERYVEALGRILLTGGETADGVVDAAAAGASDAAEERDPVREYILGQQDDHELGYFGSDVRDLIRAACEAIGRADAMVTQDLTELVHAGYYEPDDSVCAKAVRSLAADFPTNSPQVVLTEGSSDTHVIRDSLEILYPHLADYFTFLNFESSRAEGGASQLVTTVKAFAAAGIANRIIAIFDNDTAASDARRVLDGVAIPENIAILNYPRLASLEDYPTIGPTGETSMDVNELAGSIELYFGDDVLTVDGSRAPVQWRGYNTVLGRYQGEVLGKSRLREEFRRKVERCRANQSEVGNGDWTGMRAVLESILQAFHE